MPKETIHFATPVIEDDEPYKKIVCAIEHNSYIGGEEPIHTVFPMNVTCELCKRTRKYKEALKHWNDYGTQLEAIAQEIFASNVVNLFPNTPIDSILEQLNELHKQRKIKSISVAYTLTEEASGIYGTHVEAVTDATSIIGMLEYNKTTVIEILKRHIKT